MITLPNGQETEPIKIHGRAYPLWSKFVLDPSWIGGELQDLDPDSGGAITTIREITLKANGPDSAMFSVEGANWGCSCDVRYLGVSGRATPEEIAEGWIRFSGFVGHEWRIRKARPHRDEKSLCA